ATLEPSVTTDQVPPDLDQPFVVPSSKFAVNAVAANAFVTPIRPRVIAAALPTIPAVRQVFVAMVGLSRSRSRLGKRIPGSKVRRLDDPRQCRLKLSA